MCQLTRLDSLLEKVQRCTLLVSLESAEDGDMSSITPFTSAASKKKKFFRWLPSELSKKVVSLQGKLMAKFMSKWNLLPLIYEEEAAVVGWWWWWWLCDICYAENLFNFIQGLGNQTLTLQYKQKCLLRFKFKLSIIMPKTYLISVFYVTLRYVMLHYIICFAVFSIISRLLLIIYFNC